MRNKGLTPRQKVVLEVIKQFIDEHGYSPMLIEITVAAKSTVKGHLDALKAKGYITWIPGATRTISIVKELPHEQQA